jgi:hypothetical protein
VAVGDLFFCDASFNGGVCDTTISAGDTVVWDFSAATVAHTVTDCGANCNDATDTPLFRSAVIQDGSTYQFQFTQAGTYNYYCLVHPFDMRGRIIVQAAAQTPSGGTTPAASTTPAPALHPQVAVATADHRPGRATSERRWWLFGLLQ